MSINQQVIPPQRHSQREVAPHNNLEVIPRGNCLSWGKEGNHPLPSKIVVIKNHHHNILKEEMDKASKLMPLTKWGIHFLGTSLIVGPLNPLKNPSKLDSYDGIGNPYKHIEHVDIMIDYHRARSVVNFKLFVITLKRTTMMLFKTLPDGYINS